MSTKKREQPTNPAALDDLTALLLGPVNEGKTKPGMGLKKHVPVRDNARRRSLQTTKAKEKD